MKHSSQYHGLNIAVAMLVGASLAVAWSATLASNQNNPELARIFAEDQESRSEENRAAKVFPTLQEERERRITVMRLLAQGGLNTAEDYIRAVIILQHTSNIILASGDERSMSAENRILGFFLARHAHQLGHRHGAHFMAWAYNYWIRSCGLDIDKYGYKFSDGTIVPMDPTVPLQDSVTECGFDPSPYFNEVNEAPRTSDSAS